jgi:hypothetical protein
MSVVLHDEDQIQGDMDRSPFHFGDGDPRIEAIRARYRAQGTWTGPGYLTAKQRDLLGVLRAAGEPLTLRDLFTLFDGLPHSWVGHDQTSMGMTLKKLAGKGLAVQVPLSNVVGNNPRFAWKLHPRLVTADHLAPRFDPEGKPAKLNGVGKLTGGMYRRRKRRVWQREPRTCVVCGGWFREVRPLAYCSDECEQASNDPALRKLIDAQAHDAVVGDFVRYHGVSSLDEDLRLKRDPSKTAGNLYEFIAAPDGLDPVEVLMADESAEERRLLLGDMSEDEVAHLNDHTLDHLQEQLRELGMTPRGVQRKERERLRQPTRHRGGGPPMTFQPIHSKRRNRKQQQALMAGKRISRKQRGKGRRGRIERDEW